MKFKCTHLTVPGCKIQVPETWTQLMYTPVESKESGTLLPHLQVCYAGRVVWCWCVAAQREHDVISNKSREASGCRVGSHGQFVPMVETESHVCRKKWSWFWVHPSDVQRVISLMCFLRSGLAEVLHPSRDWRTTRCPSFSIFLMAGWCFWRGNQSLWLLCTHYPLKQTSVNIRKVNDSLSNIVYHDWLQ
jgi:hypothetical protein